MPAIPDPETFFLKTGLYTSFEIGIQGFIDVMRVQFFRKTLDTFCVDCGKESVFHSMSPALSLPTGPRSSITFSVDDLLTHKYQEAVWPLELLSSGVDAGPFPLSEMKKFADANRVFTVEFACSRGSGHSLYYFFRVHNSWITKVGQSPSIADLHTAGVKNYRKLLGDEKYREFTKAIGLHAHGIGIGAFVYLRRIFEKLTDSAREEAEKSGGWDKEAYARSRMDEKIRLLQGHLPSFLVENRGIYSILSLGVHELAEQVCLDIFDPLKVGIELILDEKLERLERAAKIAQTKQSLTKIREDLDKGRH